MEMKRTLIVLLVALAATACGRTSPAPATSASTESRTPNPESRKYLLERIDDAAAVQLYADGFNALFNATGSGLTNALTQLSGEAATGVQQASFDAMGQFINTLLDPFVGSRGGVTSSPAGASQYADGVAGGRSGAERDAYAAMTSNAPQSERFERRWNVWAAGYGGSQTTDGNAIVEIADIPEHVGPIRRNPRRD